jgi:hypothetical protein
MHRPSSKGKPTDPKLREKVKEEVKNETNKDGGGKGQWSAWKVSLKFFMVDAYCFVHRLMRHVG